MTNRPFGKILEVLYNPNSVVTPYRVNDATGFMLYIVNDNAVSRLTFTRIQAEDLRLAIQQIVSDQHLFSHCDTKPLDHG